MAAKKSSKKKAASKKAPKAKAPKAKKGTLVAKVDGLPPPKKGYGRFVQGNEIREVKLKKGGTRGARRKCKSK